MIRRGLFNTRVLWRGSRRSVIQSRPPIRITPALSLLQKVRFQSSDAKDTIVELKVDKPQLMVAFTCKKCDTRSSHVFSKQAYQTGTVLIQCPGCKNRHLIADNLKIFRDNKVNLEDLLKEKGQSVATTTDDLAFEDIPESLRKTLGHHAKDAPEEYQQKDDEEPLILPEVGKK